MLNGKCFLIDISSSSSITKKKRKNKKKREQSDKWSVLVCVCKKKSKTLVFCWHTTEVDRIEINGCWMFDITCAIITHISI